VWLCSGDGIQGSLLPTKLSDHEVGLRITIASIWAKDTGGVQQWLVMSITAQIKEMRDW